MVKQQMYFALVRPILEYASSVWDPHLKSDIQKIEMVQRRAARFVTKNYKHTPGTMTDILHHLKWPSLEQRRLEQRLTVMFKIQNDLIAIPIPDYVQRQKTSHTRQYHPAKFRVMAPKSNTYKFSYFPRTIQDWNSLPTSILNTQQLHKFKTALIDLR